MKYEDLLDLVKTREGYTIEFKESVNSALGREICAFANGQGGKIVLGVKDDGSIKGIELSNSAISRIQDIARNMNPAFRVNVEQIQDLAVIYVPEGKEKPYTVNDHFYLRQGANSQKLNRGEIRTFFQKENQLSFERQTSDFLAKDFSEAVLKKFKAEANISPNLSKNHILKNLNLFSNEKLNRVGILFFAKNIKRYFPSASIMCFLYADIEQTEILDSKEFAEDFLTNLHNTNSYLISKLNTALIIKNELSHRKELELPREALREAVINAMIHRDYFVQSNVQINISPARVEIINPGMLLFPKLEFGKISVRRNPILVDLVHRLGYVEKAGSGIKRIKRLCRESKTKIKFETGEFFKLTLFRTVDKEMELKGSEYGTDTAQTRQKNGTNPAQIRRKWILEYLQNHAKIDNAMVREEFSINRDTARRDLNKLVSENLMVKKSRGRNYWFELYPAYKKRNQEDDPIETTAKTTARNTAGNTAETESKHGSSKTGIRREWIIQFLRSNDKIDNRKIREKFGVNRDTARRDLNRMIEKKQIVKQGRGNRVWYELKGDKE